MSNTNTKSKTSFDDPIEPDPITGKTNWERVDAMSEEEVVARAMTDPDNPPRSAEQLRRMKTRPRVVTMRRSLRMSQEEFSDAFHIPVETIRDWEEQKSEPTLLERAYLRVIATNKEAVLKALNPVSSEEAAE